MLRKISRAREFRVASALELGGAFYRGGHASKHGRNSAHAQGDAVPPRGIEKRRLTCETIRERSGPEERRLGEALRTGGQILIDQLVAQGVERVYCVPGESFLAALDAMDGAPIEVTVCRQEAGAAMMALTEGRLTGRPGICFVTRGPGATNAAHGVHIAEHDSAPMILFIGQVERAMMGRGAFQEMDYRAFFASTAKLATQIESAAQIPEIIQRAFHTAMQGRPGPVVIALPEDMLTEMAAATDAPRVEPVADLARPDPNGGIAEDAVGVESADRRSWRGRLDQAGQRRLRSVCRAFRHGRGRLVSTRERLRRRA